MTEEVLRIRSEILHSPEGVANHQRQQIDQRLAFAQQLAVWDSMEPQFVRGME